MWMESCGIAKAKRRRQEERECCLSKRSVGQLIKRKKTRKKEITSVRKNATNKREKRKRKKENRQPKRGIGEEVRVPTCTGQGVVSSRAGKNAQLPSCKACHLDWRGAGSIDFKGFEAHTCESHEKRILQNTNEHTSEGERKRDHIGERKKERKQTTQGRDGRTARRHHIGILRSHR